MFLVVLLTLPPRCIVARANGEETAGAIKYGYGVVQGEEAGVDVKLPDEESTAVLFEGVVAAANIKQTNFPDGQVVLSQGDTLNILEYGKIWVRVKDGLTITYGEPLILVTNGTEAGKFSNSTDDGIAVNGVFIGGVNSGNIAPVEIFNCRTNA